MWIFTVYNYLRESVFAGNECLRDIMIINNCYSRLVALYKVEYDI